MSLAQWFEDHAKLYEGGTCHHRDTTFRYEPKNDKVALATAKRKREYAEAHRWDGLRDTLYAVWDKAAVADLKWPKK